jgi:hypothetical protein
VSTGTGDLTLSGAATGFQTFNAAFGVGPPFGYCVDNGTAWEIGVGHLSASTTLVRDAVEKSTNSNALVSFTGNLTVFCTASATTLNALQSLAQVHAAMLSF